MAGQATDPTGTYSFTYDNLGRLLGTGTQYSFLSGTLANTYAYDAASNRTSFTDLAGGESTYTYDSLNRLTELANTVAGNFGFGYDDLGRRTSLTRPNGVDTSYSYDNLSRLLSVLHGGGSLPGSTSYTVDAAGNRTSKTALQQADPNPVSVLSQYSYDNIYELTQAVVGGSTAETYTYDAVGNRLTSIGPATTYTNNDSNELTATSAATFTYDNNGNTTSKIDTNGTTFYTWDYENRLTSVTLPGQGGTAYFNYDPMGRRIRKAFGSATTIYAYDGDNAVEELDGSGNIVAHYTQGDGIDEPLALTGTGGTYFYHADGLGSITSLTNSSGQLAASYVYDSFGKLTASTGTIPNPFQYTGREFDPETGLYYYRARYYDPTTGRFMSEDPVQFGEGTNFYPYAHNNAINLIDPDGTRTRVCCRVLQGIVGRLSRQRHCFLLIEPENGMPAKTIGLHVNLTDSDGAFHPGGHVFPNEGSDTVKNENKSCVDVDGVTPCEEEKMYNNWQDARCRGCGTAYKLFGPNSNTFVSDFIYYFGLTPPSVKRAPGYNKPGYNKPGYNKP